MTCTRSCDILKRRQPASLRPGERSHHDEGDPHLAVRRSLRLEAGGDRRARARPQPGAHPQPRRRREPGGHLPALEHRQPRTQAALHARLRRGRGRGSGRLRRHGGEGRRPRLLGGTLTGSYAQVSLCEPAQVHPLPANVSYAQGAAMNIPYATAYHALFHRAHGLAGETVLVHGASGGVGTGAVQLARARGLTVIGTAGTERGRRLVLEQGAHHVIDHTAPGYLDELLPLTGGRGVDIVLEMLANENLQKDLGILAVRGRIVVIGNRGTVEINARLAMNKDAAILGMALFHATAPQLAGIHAALVEGLRNGTLRPVIGQELPLAEAPRAHEAVMEAGHYGKVVLVP